MIVSPSQFLCHLASLFLHKQLERKLGKSEEHAYRVSGPGQNPAMQVSGDCCLASEQGSDHS